MSEANTITPLSQTEYDLVSEAIYRLVKQYEFPEDVGEIDISYLTSDAKENICVIPTQDNAQYRQWYIDGSFSASVDFQIAYKCYPRSDNQKILSQKIVAGIMAWLENTGDLPALTDKRKVTDITLLNTFSAVDEKGEDGNMVFVSTATLTYKKNF